MTNQEQHDMAQNDLEVVTILPEGVNGFEYVRNHHFIKFTNKKGESLKLVAHDQMLYSCPEGCLEFLTESNHGNLKCPVCGTLLKSKWGRAQICFAPEEESAFSFPTKK